MGEENFGLVIATDHAGTPASMKHVRQLASVAGTQELRLEVRLPAASGNAWQTRWAGTGEDTGIVSDDSWRTDLATGAAQLSAATWVPPNDWHWDAKCYPCMHPYGTGSAYAEPGSGGIQHYVANRLALVQPCFRRSATWVFQQLDRLITNDLYHTEKCRRQAGRPSAKKDEPDAYRKIYGVTPMANVPETPAWWNKQSRNL